MIWILFNLMFEICIISMLTNNTCETRDMQHQLKTMMDQHTSSRGHVALPVLKPVKSIKGIDGLSVTDITMFKPKSIFNTPTLNKGTKELCEKLDNIDAVVNDINQYIMNHKSVKINSDTFIINKLTGIQDHIEDSHKNMEYVDNKIMDLTYESKMLPMNNNKSEEYIKQIKQEIVKLLKLYHSGNVKCSIYDAAISDGTNETITLNVYNL